MFTRKPRAAPHSVKRASRSSTILHARHQAASNNCSHELLDVAERENKIREITGCTVFVRDGGLYGELCELALAGALARCFLAFSFFHVGKKVCMSRHCVRRWRRSKCSVIRHTQTAIDRGGNGMSVALLECALESYR